MHLRKKCSRSLSTNVWKKELMTDGMVSHAYSSPLKRSFIRNKKKAAYTLFSYLQWWKKSSFLLLSPTDIGSKKKTFSIMLSSCLQWWNKNRRFKHFSTNIGSKKKAINMLSSYPQWWNKIVVSLHFSTNIGSKKKAINMLSSYLQWWKINES